MLSSAVPLAGVHPVGGRQPSALRRRRRPTGQPNSPTSPPSANSPPASPSSTSPASTVPGGPPTDRHRPSRSPFRHDPTTTATEAAPLSGAHQRAALCKTTQKSPTPPVRWSRWASTVRPERPARRHREPPGCGDDRGLHRVSPSCPLPAVAGGRWRRLSGPRSNVHWCLVMADRLGVLCHSAGGVRKLGRRVRGSGPATLGA